MKYTRGLNGTDHSICCAAAITAVATFTYTIEQARENVIGESLYGIDFSVILEIVRRIKSVSTREFSIMADFSHLAATMERMRRPGQPGTTIPC